MAVLTVQKHGLTGLNPTLANAGATGDKFPNDGRTLLQVKNGSASPITVTVAAYAACSHGTKHDAVVSIPAGATHQIGPFPVDRFNDPVTGQVSVTYSAVATVTVAATSLGQVY